MKNRLLTLGIAFLLCSCSSATAADTSQTDQIQTEQTVQAEQTEGTQPAPEETEAEKIYSCDDVAQAIMKEIEFPTMVAVTPDDLGLYLDVQIPDDAELAMYVCGSGGFADEICIIKGTSLDQDSLKAAAEKRITSRLKDFEDYNPDESGKLDSAQIKCMDGCFMYFITADNDRCEDIANEMLF